MAPPPPPPPPPPPSLVGPPELYATKTPSPTSTAADSFMDLMVANFNSPTLPGRLPKGFTLHHSPTFLSTGNPCLDFFFHTTPSDSFTPTLSKSWSHNPLTTLKLIANLRAVDGTGKSDREAFFTAALWLHENHPISLALNIQALAQFRDLPEILYRLLQGPNVRRIQKQERTTNKKKGFRLFVKHKKWKKKIQSSVMREIRMSKAAERSKREKEEAKILREEKTIAMAKKLMQRYEKDWDFQFLHEKISDYFSECLKADLALLNSKEYEKITSAAKWCPSLDSSFDRSTLLCECIAKKVFPRGGEYEGLEEERHYVYRVRDRLRKEVLVPLRRVLELPEVFMAEKEWEKIKYEKVDALAMKFHKEKFLKHDGERFINYLKEVGAGRMKMAVDDLFPHSIVESLNDNDDGEVAELQWRRMVEDLSKLGRFQSCLAFSDVSKNMMGVPMEASLVLGLLVSELSEEPWKGKLITFSDQPRLHVIKGDDLKSKMEFVESIEWGKSGRLQSVFDLILQVAERGGLKEEEMVKRVFVFTDMEFDQDSGENGETDYDVVKRKFSEKGYAVPEIVFWKLRDSASTPVPASQKGVALLSGFSKNLLKIFLEDIHGEINPERIMEAAISGHEYDKLVTV